MAINCLAPGFMRLFYESNGHNHQMVLPVIPNTVAPSFLLRKKGGGTISQSDAVVALWSVVSPIFADADTLSGWEAFTQADCASAPVFQNPGTAVGLVGSSGIADQQWVQAVLTFKTVAGGRGRFTLLEQANAQDQKASLSSLSATPVGDLVDYLTGADSWVVARDGSYLGLPLNFVTKVNDALRKKFLNP